jgi:hypothetical protein
MLIFAPVYKYCPFSFAAGRAYTARKKNILITDPFIWRRIIYRTCFQVGVEQETVFYPKPLAEFIVVDVRMKLTVTTCA